MWFIYLKRKVMSTGDLSQLGNLTLLIAYYHYEIFKSLYLWIWDWPRDKKSLSFVYLRFFHVIPSLRYNKIGITYDECRECRLNCYIIIINRVFESECYASAIKPEWRKRPGRHRVMAEQSRVKFITYCSIFIILLSI